MIRKAKILGVFILCLPLLSTVSFSSAIISVDETKTITIDEKNYLNIPSYCTAIKRGSGALKITKPQGQSHDINATDDEALSGTIQLDEGLLSIGHNDALGNGYQWNGSAAVPAPNNILLINGGAVVAEADISRLSVPVMLKSKGSSMQTGIFNLNNHNITLSKIAVENSEASSTIILVNDSTEPVMRTFKVETLDTEYTPQETLLLNNEPINQVLVSPFVNFEPNKEHRSFQTVILANHNSQLSITDDQELPYIALISINT